MVIDGQQRLLSILFFKENKFPKPKNTLGRDLKKNDELMSHFLSNEDNFSNFRLSLVSSNDDNKRNYFENKNYNDLVEQHHKFNYIRTIRTMVVKQVKPANDNSVIYSIFDRLNTGGVRLTPQEIRMNFYASSEFYKMLISLNEAQKWRELLNMPSPEPHYRDIETLLRLFGLLEDLEDYRPPMVDFLNRYSNKMKKLSETDCEYYVRFFDSFLKACEKLNESSFKGKTAKFQVTVLEPVFVAIGETSFKDKTFIDMIIKPNLLEKFKNNDIFDKTSNAETSRKESIMDRIKLARTMVEYK